jgi:NADPH:quinone reductase-like Zn-dependent oxidoreductase
VALPEIAANEALVEVKAAGINGSDAASVMGFIPFTTLPRIPGRDYAGIVAKVGSTDAEHWVGAEVWGSGGERGFLYDGTFAQYVKVPIESLSKKPKALTFAQAASRGLAWVCSWLAVDTLSQVKKGDNVLVIGARGAIGSGAVQLANERGAKVFGTYRSISGEVPPYLEALDLSTGSIKELLAKKGVMGQIDVVIDAAGHEAPFNDALPTVKGDGTARAVVMAVHNKDGKFAIDLRTFYLKALTLKGLKSNQLTQVEVKQALDYISARYDEGKFFAPLAPKEVKLSDEEAIHAALKEALTLSAELRTVVVP